MTACCPKGPYDLGSDCHAWLLPEGRWGESNTGLVRGAGVSVLVDTLYDLQHTAEMLDACAPLTASYPIRTLVNTHSDADHWFGNQLIAGPGVEIVASAAAAEFMTPAVVAEMAGLSGREDQVGEFVRSVSGHFDLSGITATPPTRTFTGELDLDVGGRQVRLIQVSPAHTPGDVLVYVPDAKVVYFQGDRAADVEEVAGEHGRGVRAEELPPGGVAAQRGGWYPQPSQYPPHRRGADADTQALQFALDPLVARGRVLARHLLDQHRELGVDRRTAVAVGIGPVPADQPTLPAQQRVRRDEPVHPQRPGEQPRRGGEHRPVGPVQAGPGVLPPQHRHFLAQHQQPGILRRRRTGKQRHPASHPDEDQVEHPHGHKPAMLPAAQPKQKVNPQASHLCPLLKPHRGEDTELFFPIGNTGPSLLQIEEAKAVCAQCVVIVQCRQWAFDSGEDTGVRGGLSEDERRVIRRSEARR